MEGDLYALVWTTTPWTLPANEAVTYKSDMDYSIVNIDGLDGHYILATKLITDLETSLSKEVKTVQTIPGNFNVNSEKSYYFIFRLNDLLSEYIFLFHLEGEV